MNKEYECPNCYSMIDIDLDMIPDDSGYVDVVCNACEDEVTILLSRGQDE